MHSCSVHYVVSGTHSSSSTASSHIQVAPLTSATSLFLAPRTGNRGGVIALSETAHGGCFVRYAHAGPRDHRRALPFRLHICVSFHRSLPASLHGKSTWVYIWCQFFTLQWLPLLLYLAWFIYDRNSPKKGGYPSLWFRSWRVHSWLADYFPVTLHKTAELPPDQVYLDSP